MQITLTEQIIVAFVTMAGTLGVGWLTLRGVLRKADQEATATGAIARAELERLLMARIDQLQIHITALEERITLKDARIAELETRVDELEAERDQWKNEAAQLRAELAKICGERQTGKRKAE